MATLARSDTLAPGTLDAALREMRDALGDEGVFADPEKLAEFGDPFAPADDPWFRPGAVLQPNSVEEIQAVLRIATRHGTPVWTNGQGRNNGYGGAAPRVSGSFVIRCGG